MFEDKWQDLFEDDLEKLSEIIKPVRKKTVKLEEGENRIVSIFFLDVKGFTAMSEKLHPEQLKRIMNKIFKVFSNVILKYGGYLLQYEGDKIMALFGSKVTSETDTERAIRSGLEILNKLKYINEMLKPKKIELSIRIGINTGLVSTGKVGLERESDFTVYGDAVNLASRMEENAFLNSIMIPLETKKLVANIFQFVLLGKIEVKGIFRPVEVYRVMGITLKKVERWERSKPFNKPEYVGRDKELKQIEELYDKSKSQIGEIDPEYKPIVIGLRSPAGLGKSRLIFEFTQRIKKKYKLDSTANIKVSGYTKSYAQAPYTLWTSLIKNYIGINETDSKQVVKDKFESMLLEIFNELSDSEKENFESTKPILGFLLGLTYEDKRLNNPDPKRLQTETHLTLRYFIEAVTKIANKQNYPLLIILEDLHLIDESSLNAFKTILTAFNVEEKNNNRPCKNMFIILAYRDEFELIREFDFRTVFIEFKLKPLSSDNSDQMIKSMLGKINIPQKIKTELLNKSEGNPFYIEEWIQSLIEEDIIYTKNGKWQIKEDVENIHTPDTLNNLILSRIDRMEERLRLLLQKASVIGNSFLQSILEAIEKRLGNDEPIQPELSELINLDWFIKEKELEESDAQYIFKHILACDVAYQTILNYNKKILHKLIAEFVEERFKDNKEYYVFLANHYEKAEVTEKTIEYLEKAGDYAKENYQNGLAIAFYDKLLKISDSQLVISDSKLIDIILKKCNVLQLIGKWNDAEMGFKKALSLSEKLKDKKKIGTSIGSLGWQLYLKSEYEKAMECYENQLKIAKELGDKNVISMIIGHMGVIYWEKGNYNKSMECYKKQLKISEKFRDKSGISIALGHIGLIYWERGEYEEAMKYYEKELNMSRELGNKKGISIATGNMGNIYAKKGNYNKAMECYKKSLKIFEELGDKSGTSTAVGNMGIVYKIEGDYNKAMKCYEKQLKICKELEDKSGISYTFSNIGSVYRAKGDYGRAIDYHKNDLKICEELKDKRGISYAVSNLGNAYKDKGDPQKALECYERSLKIADELGDKKRISIAVENMGIVYSEKGDYDKAMQCYDKAIFIGKELGIKIVLSEYLIDKAELLFLLKKFDESKIINEEGFQIAQEVKEKNNIFRAKVLSAKIDFALAKDDTSQNNAISKLQEMLSKTEDDEEKATLNYELGIMNEELKKEDISKKYKGEALRLYKELYKKTPKFEYKKRIEELK